MSHWKSHLNNYHGSKVLLPLANQFGIQVDKLNFLAAGFTTVILAYVYSLLLHFGRLSVRSSKVLLILLGFVVLYFCFGRDLIHVVIEAFLGYILVRIISLENLPQVTMIVALGYQTMLHMYRQYVDPGGYTIDITGGLMMLTQRVTAVAFSLRDAAHFDDALLTPYQRRAAIKTTPDALTYFAYMFDFHMLLAGPLVPYTTFCRIADGKNVRPDGSQPINHRRIISQLVCVCVSIPLLLKLSPLIKEESLMSKWFMEQYLFIRILYLMGFCFVCRIQYYIAWKLAEATCHASCYGYYIDEDANEHWDGADNINIQQVEFATSMKKLIDNWNISTQRWLKHVCYDRNIHMKTLRTFLLSALWHGLYPGYYLSFFTNMYFVIAAREVRHRLRPILLSSKFCPKLIYDIITWLFTISFLAYTAIPFIVLHYEKSIHIWKQLYFFGHILATLAFTLRLFFKRDERDHGNVSKKCHKIKSS